MLVELHPSGSQDDRHRHRTAGPGGRERGVDRDIADHPSGCRQPRQLGEVQLLGRNHRGKRGCPQPPAQLGVGERERDDESQPAQERLVEGTTHVGRQHREPPVGLHPLEQVVDLDVGVAVVAVLHLTAAAEQRVRLVEEQQRTTLLGGVEQFAQVLLGFADVLAHHGRQVDAVQIQPELPCQHLRGHRLTGPARPGEQRADPQPAGGACRESPVVVYQRPPADLVGELTEQGEL